MYRKRKGSLSALYLHITVVCPHCSASLSFITLSSGKFMIQVAQFTPFYTMSMKTQKLILWKTRRENQAYIITKQFIQ